MYLDINHNMYLQRRYNILAQYHGNYILVQILNYLLVIDIFRNSAHTSWVSQCVIFKGFGAIMTPKHPAS